MIIRKERSHQWLATTPPLTNTYSSLQLPRANRLLEDLLHPQPEDDGDALAAALEVEVPALGGGDGDTSVAAL